VTWPEFSLRDPDEPATPSADTSQHVKSSNREHLRPGFISSYPRFEIATVRQRLETLDETWDQARYEKEFREYDRTRRGTAARHAIFFCAPLLTIIIWTIWGIQSEPALEAALLWLLLSLLAIVGLIGLTTLLIRMLIDAARGRFFRYIGDALRLIWIADRDEILSVNVPLILNHLGSAARALLLSLQGSRRAWRSPPTVSDRALRISAPLIDMEIPDDLHVPGTAAGAPRKHLDQFLRDVAAVVAIGREDLIPRVREEYPELAHRSGDPDTHNRDLTYLNPMRTRSRWEVAKDFWYPLASWLSLVVATAALIISIAR
jgi:hypothetical protein